MQIQNVNIKNFKGVRSYEGEIKGKNVYLMGANGSGKTSFIDAIWCGLTGKNLPPTPITDDGKRGLIEIDLGDFIARTKFKKGRAAEFEIENKLFTEEADKFVKAPRSFMEQKLGILNFDINDFFKKSAAEQVKYYSKIMNEDFTDIDSEIEEIVESRKFDKRKLAEIGKDINYFNEDLAKRDLVSVLELSKKLDIEKEKKVNYDRVVGGVGNRTSRIILLKEEIEQLQKELNDGEKWVETKENQPDELAIESLKNEIQNSEKTNDEIREAKAAQKADQDTEELKNSIKEQNDAIELLKIQKAARISRLIKIDGLEYSIAEERFLWEGLPFDPKQTNTASQLIAGMKIGSTLLNELKILKVDASLIDKVQFNKVLEWADNEGIELFVELVDREAAKLVISVQDES
jgi:predicted ATP-dependent endonuclease of OLD family